MACSHFRNSSNDQDKPSPSSSGENTYACLPSIPDGHHVCCRFPTLMGSKNTVMFHFNETTDENGCLTFLYLHFIFSTLNFIDQEVQKPPVKNFIGHTDENTAGSIPSSAYFSPKIDDRHCNRIYWALFTCNCFEDGYMGKQPVASKYFSRYIAKTALNKWKPYNY